MNLALSTDYKLSNPYKEIKTSSLDKCIKLCNDENNKCIGISYPKNNSKCLFSNSTVKNKIINNDEINQYNISTYNKTKKTKDFTNLIDQQNSKNYFQKINNINKSFDEINDTLLTNNLEDCMNYCHNDLDDKCNSFMFYEKKDGLCSLYNNNDHLFKNNNDPNEYYLMKNNEDNQKNKRNNNQNNNLENLENHENHENQHKIENIGDNIKITKCIEIKNVNDIKELNTYCKNQYGNDYIYFKDEDSQSMISCNGYDNHNNNDNFYKLKCIPEILNKNEFIEKFENRNQIEIPNVHYINIIYLLILLIFIIIIIYVITKY